MKGKKRFAEQREQLKIVRGKSKERAGLLELLLVYFLYVLRPVRKLVKRNACSRIGPSAESQIWKVIVESGVRLTKVVLAFGTDACIIQPNDSHMFRLSESPGIAEDDARVVIGDWKIFPTEESVVT